VSHQGMRNKDQTRAQIEKKITVMT